MELRLKWSTVGPLPSHQKQQPVNNLKTSDFTGGAAQPIMMSLSSSSRASHLLSRALNTGQSAFAFLPLRIVALLLLLALQPHLPVAEATRQAASSAVANRRAQTRYSGCNVINMYGSCRALHRPDFLNSISGGSFRPMRSQCLPMLAFLRCAIFKMACRSRRSQNDLIVQVPCQMSCEQAVTTCGRFVQDDSAWDHLRVTDCQFLPAGGCLDWTTSNRRRSQFLPSAIRNNKFCRGSRPPCNTMFPNKFKRRDWRRGNFSIAVDILIKSVMWFFQGSRVHSYLTAEVKRVFKSNIGLERGLQHTILWPASCYCAGQILVGHRYYLLAHSIRNAHEFNVSINSVFLPKLKRYRKRFPCWVNRRCSRKKRRDRRRRRRSIRRWRVRRF